MSQRGMLRIVYWLVFVCVVFLSVSDTGASGRGGPGYFIRYQDDWLMLLVGVAVLAVLAVIGFRI